MRHRVYDWLRRHPLVVDAGIAALLWFGLGLSYARERDFMQALLGAALLAPLIWRRRYPATVFAVISLLCFVQVLVLDIPVAGDVAFLFALYAVSAYDRRARMRFAALGVGFLGAVVAVLDWSFLASGTEAFDVAAQLLLPIAMSVALSWTFGDLMRTRRAYVGQLEERARRLETERDQQAQLARSAERASIAREFHDVIAHSLAIVIAQADGGRYAAKKQPGAAEQALDTIASTSRQALAEMRRLLGILRSENPDAAASTEPGPTGPGPAEAGSHDRRPGTEQAGSTARAGAMTFPHLATPPAAGAEFAPQPDISRIPELVERFRAGGMTVTLAATDLPPAPSPGVELAAYRIVQEALTNALKHGGQSVSASVSLGFVRDRAPGVLRVRVSDDGLGAAATPSRTDPGHGLSGMRERVALYGGTLAAGPKTGGGFQVVAELPYA